MIDAFEKQKHEIDIGKLSVLLKAPVVAVNAKTGRGRSELIKKLSEVMNRGPVSPFETNGHVEDGENAKIFARYNFISEVVQESVKHNDRKEHRLSEKIDRVLTHKVFGL
jgi:Fe2+ transport system protein B